MEKVLGRGYSKREGGIKRQNNLPHTFNITFLVREIRLEGREGIEIIAEGIGKNRAVGEGGLEVIIHTVPRYGSFRLIDSIQFFCFLTGRKEGKNKRKEGGFERQREDSNPSSSNGLVIIFWWGAGGGAYL